MRTRRSSPDRRRRPSACSRVPGRGPAFAPPCDGGRQGGWCRGSQRGRGGRRQEGRSLAGQDSRDIVRLRGVPAEELLFAEDPEIVGSRDRVFRRLAGPRIFDVTFAPGPSSQLAGGGASTSASPRNQSRRARPRPSEPRTSSRAPPRSSRELAVRFNATEAVAWVVRPGPRRHRTRSSRAPSRRTGRCPRSRAPWRLDDERLRLA